MCWKTVKRPLKIGNCQLCNRHEYNNTGFQLFHVRALFLLGSAGSVNGLRRASSNVNSNLRFWPFQAPSDLTVSLNVHTVAARALSMAKQP